MSKTFRSLASALSWADDLPPNEGRMYMVVFAKCVKIGSSAHVGIRLRALSRSRSYEQVGHISRIVFGSKIEMPFAVERSLRVLLSTYPHAKGREWFHRNSELERGVTKFFQTGKWGCLDLDYTPPKATYAPSDEHINRIRGISVITSVFMDRITKRALDIGLTKIELNPELLLKGKV